MRVVRKDLVVFLFIILFLFHPPTIHAQAPATGTATDPVWYYIQVEGEDDRASLVFTAAGTQVFGRAMSTDPSTVDSQLWRFERSGDNYTIINRAGGKKLDIAYNASKGISVGVLNDNPITQWQWLPTGNYFNIKATVAPAGGDASKIYAHQANNWDSRNYVIMFENSGYNGTANSRFRFVLYEDFAIELSSDDKLVWYFISSAKPEYLNKGITDVVSEAHPDVKFSLETIRTNDDRQQWKAVGKGDEPGDGRIHFINKATGNLIRTHSVYDHYYYFTQSTDRLEQSNGWTTRYLGGKQFEIYGTEDDGTTRYLNAASKEQSRPDWLLDENTKDTGFAWILKKVDDVSAVDNPRPEYLRIYSKEKRIIVEGSDDYTVRNLQGVQMNRNARLATGIYLVTVDVKTYKTFVK
jgi:hypothetical protein